MQIRNHNVTLYLVHLIKKKFSFSLFLIAAKRWLLLLGTLFFNSSSHRLFLRPMTFSISVTSTALQLKFVCVTSFVLLLGQLRDLLKNVTSELL